MPTQFMYMCCFTSGVESTNRFYGNPLTIRRDRMNLYSSRHLRISSIILAMKAAHMIHVRRNMFRLFRYTLFPLRPPSENVA